MKKILFFLFMISCSLNAYPPEWVVKLSQEEKAFYNRFEAAIIQMWIQKSAEPIREFEKRESRKYGLNPKVMQAALWDATNNNIDYLFGVPRFFDHALMVFGWRPFIEHSYLDDPEELVLRRGTYYRSLRKQARSQKRSHSPEKNKQSRESRQHSQEKKKKSKKFWKRRKGKSQ